jgi:tripartite-type tricarboxylate transporter receptor subunit TctC
MTYFRSSLLHSLALIALLGASAIAWAKADRGKGNFGSIGNGSANHLVSVLFERAAGIQSVFAPDQGAAPAIQGLFTGEIDSLEVDLAAAMSMITSGKLSAFVARAQFAGVRSKTADYLPSARARSLPLGIHDQAGRRH